VRRRGQAAFLLPLLALLLLPGCSATGRLTGAVERLSSSKLTQEGPLDWWHDLQGGRIAEGRPPPPGATDPYPNLSEVPARPTPTDPAVRRALTAQLAAERDRTERQAAQDPITPFAGTPPAAGTPASASTTPGRPAKAARGVAPAAPADPDASMATLDAATAPPAKPTPAAPASKRAPAPTAAAPGAPGAVVQSGPVQSGPLPALPTGAPAVPQLPGLPASTFALATPRPAPQAVVAFAQGSAALPDSADPALRALAARRAGGGIEVSAGGDGEGGPERQATALPLGMARARAIQDALVAAGVPMAAIRTEASGLGRTGSARLLP
jgi:outer membrane protein OmpA-like peptidoglycan-associated protein